MASMQPLSRERCLALLASVPVGRVVFTVRALPAIRPVNHLVDGDSIVIRTNLGSALGSTATEQGGLVVAYEADLIDLDARCGWTVVVTGGARAVADQDRLTRYERLLRPWVDEPMNYIIAIDCDLVSGYELVAPAW
jgi:nitroimidazol reductase NimA-like FMN-containing flavoprotein (pyridoxamine 5'-phosphate oxidase superfamily)